MQARKSYPSDLLDAQWTLISLLIPPAKPGGRPRAVSLREVMNALLYLERSGCQCDMLLHDLPPKSSVFEYIEVFYNRVRRHSALNYQSPTQFAEAA